jgi:hypothetical protein
VEAMPRPNYLRRLPELFTIPEPMVFADRQLT